MARKKRASSILEKALKRLSGLQAISASLDLGEDLTVKNYEKIIASLQKELNTYNQLLSQVDDQSNKLKNLEGAVKELSERFISAVAGRFGKDSSEYEMAGGKRKSERKRPSKKTSEEKNGAKKKEG